MLKLNTLALLIGSSSILLGCSTAGLGHVPSTRENYNIALNNSDNEQFLLNIARMHDNKTPFFVGVDSITTQTSLNYSSGGGDTSFGNSYSGFGIAWNILPSITFTQSPTITYSPMQGTSYISGLLTPLDLTKLYYLVETNLELSTVLKLSLEQLGPLYNHDNFMTNGTGDNNDFNNFVTWLDQQRIDGKLNLYLSSYQKAPALLLYISDDKVAAQVAKTLRLKHIHHKLLLSPNVNSMVTTDNLVKINTRSVFAVLNFLSNGIVNQDTNNVVTKIPQSTTGDMFKLYMSTNSPSKVYNKVKYEDKWYYIQNNDIQSKTTLMLLKIMFALQSGEISSGPWSVVNAPNPTE
ncbi:MAG: hypothetical protein RLZZ293_737 [Pseudomonadota bacterium]|jgi:hypothetical protein